MTKTGSPRSITAGEHEALRQLVQEHPQATMPELAAAWAEFSGGEVMSLPALRRGLKDAGLQRKRPPMQLAPRAKAQAPSYGYNERHRGATAALTDEEWALAQDLFEQQPGARGRPALHDRRSMVEACCYVLRTGAAWRSLPEGIYPPWQSVHKAFVVWARDGRFEKLQDRLRQQWRQRLGRAAQPTHAVIDSQSTRGSAQGGGLGFDAGKKVKGRKRHLVVDKLGLLLAVLVTSAAVPDRDAAAQVVEQARSRTAQSISKLWADSAYGGQCAQDIQQRNGVEVCIVRSSTKARWDDAQQSLWPLPQAQHMPAVRWVVERTHAWLERNRRLVMHHDRKPVYSTAWVWLAQARLLLNRLA
jgi:putative transposase